MHVAQLGGYYLLVGRDNKLFAPLERRFWYGLTAAVAVLSIAGLMVGADHAPRTHVARLQHPAKPCPRSSMAI